MDNELQKAREIIEDIRARCGQAILDEPMNTLAMEVRMAASKLLPIVNKALSQPAGKAPTPDAALREAGDKLNNAVWVFLKTPKEDGFDAFAHLQKASQEWEDAGGTAAWHYVEPNQRGTNYIAANTEVNAMWASFERELDAKERERMLQIIKRIVYKVDEEPRLRTPVNPTPIDPKDIPDERKSPKDPS